MLTAAGLCHSCMLQVCEARGLGCQLCCTGCVRIIAASHFPGPSRARSCQTVSVTVDEHIAVPLDDHKMHLHSSGIAISGLPRLARSSRVLNVGTDAPSGMAIGVHTVCHRGNRQVLNPQRIGPGRYAAGLYQASQRKTAAGAAALGMAFGVQLGPCANNGLGHCRLNKAGAIAVLLEVVLRTISGTLQLMSPAPSIACRRQFYLAS